MPIRRHQRGFYPIDWPQLSAAIRFGRAGGRCETCGRPHGKQVVHLGDGRWYDLEFGVWRDGDAQPLAHEPTLLEISATGRVTRVVLATAHRDHDTSNNDPTNLAAWCQRCHLIHDRFEHLRRRKITYLRRRALGDLFRGTYPGLYGRM